MAYNIIHGGFGGPGDVGLGLSQGLLGAAQAYAARPSPWANFGAGLGQGFSRGVDLAIQDKYAQKREDRVLSRQEKQQEAYLNRMQEQQDAISARQFALERYRAVDDQYQQSYEAIRKAIQAGNVSPDLAIEFDRLNNDHLADASDPLLQNMFSPEDWMQQDMQFKQSIIGLTSRLPKQPTPLEQIGKSWVLGSELNDQYVANAQQRLGVLPDGFQGPYDPTAAYQYNERYKNFDIVPGTGELEKAKAAAERAKIGSGNYPPTVKDHPAWQPYLQEHPEIAAWPLDEKGKPLIPFPKPDDQPNLPPNQDPEAMSKFRKMAADEWKAENGNDIPAPGGWIEQRANAIADSMSQVGERSSERKAVETLMRNDPDNAPAIQFLYQQVVDQSRQRQIPPEVLIEREIRETMSQPGSNANPDVVRRVQLLNRIKKELDAIK